MRIASRPTPASRSRRVAPPAKAVDPQTSATLAPSASPWTSSARRRPKPRAPWPLPGGRDEGARVPELRAARDVGRRARRDGHADEVRHAEVPRVADHRNERHRARAAAERDGRGRAVPDEEAADGQAHLDLVADPGDVGEEPAHLAVLVALHQQLDALLVRGGEDRVRALRGVAVLRAQPHDAVLAGKVRDPVGHVEPQQDGRGRRVLERRDRRRPPLAADGRGDSGLARRPGSGRRGAQRSPW